MSIEQAESGEGRELSVTQTRDHFTERVDRAHYGGEATYITRSRRHQRAAAIVPADLVDHYEQLLEERDARVAAERLADIEAGRSRTVPFDRVLEEAGLSGELGR